MALTNEFWQDLNEQLPGWGDPDQMDNDLEVQTSQNFRDIFRGDQVFPQPVLSAHCCGVAEIGGLAGYNDSRIVKQRTLRQLAYCLGRKKSRIFYYAPPQQGNYDIIKDLLLKYGFTEQDAFYNANSGNDVVGFVNDIGALRWYTEDGLYSPKRKV